ncbi:MAG TPA: hypothetical protein ENI23_06060 [bacterium]|nr:hypothetical protein [bacterium]
MKYTELREKVLATGQDEETFNRELTLFSAGWDACEETCDVYGDPDFLHRTFWEHFQKGNRV